MIRSKLFCPAISIIVCGRINPCKTQFSGNPGENNLLTNVPFIRKMVVAVGCQSSQPQDIMHEFHRTSSKVLYSLALKLDACCLPRAYI